MPEQEFPFKGVWIPAEVFTDVRLTQTDKFLWSLVHILSNQKGCYASKTTLGKYLNVSERNVQYGLARLEACGFITRDSNGVCWDCVSQSLGGETDFTQGVKNSSPQGCNAFHPIDTRDRNKRMVKEQPDLDDSFIKSVDELNKLWHEYLAWRRSHRKPTDNAYVNRWNAKFKSWGAEHAIEAVRRSLENGYQGIFRPMLPRGFSSGPKSSQDHAKGF
jgi:hypothetical protein